MNEEMGKKPVNSESSSSDLPVAVKEQNNEEDELNRGSEMPFLDHLEELRRRILWSLGAVFIGIIVGFFQMKVELSGDELVIKYGVFYRKVIKTKEIQSCSLHKMLHPIRTYGGWGIRKGKDGTLALTQAFVNDGIKLEITGKTFIISSRMPESLRTAIESVKG